MKTITTLAIVLSFALAAGGAMAAIPKAEVGSGTLAVSSASGSNSGCLDFLVLWISDGDHSPVGDSEKIESVAAGAGWTASSDDGTVWIDFYDDDGVLLSSASGPDSGTVPTDAAYAYGCVVVGGSWPDVPVPGASFTYEDGN